MRPAAYRSAALEVVALAEQRFHDLAVAELDAVYRLACHLARTRNEAEDMVQETYLRAFRAADTFTLGPYGIRPWLFTILRNVVFARSEQAQRERSVLKELAQQRSPEAPAENASMDWENVDQHLKAAIGSLTVESRLVFLLWALEGLKYREIAEVVGVPLGTVMSRLSRAREQLSEKLADQRASLGIKRSTSRAVACTRRWRAVGGRSRSSAGLSRVQPRRRRVARRTGGVRIGDSAPAHGPFNTRTTIIAHRGRSHVCSIAH